MIEFQHANDWSWNFLSLIRIATRRIPSSQLFCGPPSLWLELNFCCFWKGHVRDMPFSKTTFSLGVKRVFGINIFNPKRNENFPSGMSKVLCEVDKILSSILSLRFFSNIFVFFPFHENSRFTLVSIFLFVIKKGSVVVFGIHGYSENTQQQWSQRVASHHMMLGGSAPKTIIW